ncbi:MAG: PDZ domain-containing protein [Gaiellaceae bacterium]
MRGALRPTRLVALVVLAAGLLAAVLWLIPSGHYLLLPDPARPVDPLVRVPGEKEGEASRGNGIYFVAVIERRASVLERLFPGLREGSTLIPAGAISPPGVDDAARRQGDLREMKRSQSIAAAVALKALGYKVVARPTGVLVTGVFDGTPAVGKLQPTDIVVSVNGRPVRTPGDLRRLLGRRRPGDRVRLGVRRGKELREVVVKTAADPADATHAIIGIQIGQAADIRLPLAVTIDAGGVGGPSAGLAFALDVMEELGRDVDRGYRVAATGAIDLHGNVGQIGGVRQKTYGVREADVDIFLVPAGKNATEARRHAGGVRVIAVKTFPQALRALATLPPKA